MAAGNELVVGEPNSPARAAAMAFYVASPLFVIAILIWSGLADKLDWFYVTMFFALWFVTGMGITFGYHRYLTHQSFTLPMWGRWVTLIIGAMAIENDAISWVATHKKHHQHSDKEGDPHSPVHGFGEGFRETLQGFYNAHCGWILEGRLVENIYIPEHMAIVDKDTHIVLKETDRVAWAIRRYYPLVIIVSYGLPMVAGIVYEITFGDNVWWVGLILGLLVGGFLRVAFVHHITWCVNSLGHLHGQKPFITGDESRDLPLVYPLAKWLTWRIVYRAPLTTLGYIMAILSLGELYHNGHHGMQSSARHAIAHRYHVDVTWYVIRILAWLGVVTEVRAPTRAQVEARLEQQEKIKERKTAKANTT